MTKDDFDFDTWFDNLSSFVLDLTGIEFSDRDSVREDYEQGRNLADVAGEIADEYND